MLVRRNLRIMPAQAEVPDTLDVSGDYENRVLEVPRVAQLQALAQRSAAPRMQDALVDFEDALSDQIARLGAADADQADAEESGEAERKRRAYYPLRAA